jgi:hypothetical protein
MPYRAPAEAPERASLSMKSIGDGGEAVRRTFAAAVFSALLAFAPIAAAQVRHDAGRYEALIERVKAGDLDVDFQALRYAYAESSGYRPYRSPTDSLAGAMFRAYKAQDFDGAIEAANKILAINYLDIDAQVLCDLSYRMLSNAIAAEPCHDMAARLLRSIYESGDGRTPESAYQVIAEREEYSLLNAMGLAPIRQELVSRDGHSFDARDVIDNATGETRTIYFNIDRPRRWLERQPGAPKR